MDNYALQVDIGKGIFLQHDQQRMIRKFALRSDAQWIFLTYLNTPCRIDRNTGGIEEYADGVWRECRDYSTVMTIYDLLCFSKGEHCPELAGQWCAVGEFVVTGVTNTEVFTGKYAQRFDGRLAQLRSACVRLGGELLPRIAGADLSCRFAVMPFFPVLLQFWQADEDFPAKLLILWDRNADKFLHFETTFYLQGDLLRRLEQNMQKG